MRSNNQNNQTMMTGDSYLCLELVTMALTQHLVHMKLGEKASQSVGICLT